MTEDTITETRRYRAIVEYLSRDGGAVPCSRYGRNGGQCAEVAAVVDMIVGRETGEGTSVESVEAAISMVVNDSDDPAITLIMNGPEHGIDATLWLGEEEVERFIREDIALFYDRDTQDAH